MGSAFTTSFNFQGKTYATVVNMTVKEKDLTIYFHVPDESLHYLLPHGKMTYNSQQGLMEIQGAEKLLTQELVGCMVRAIEHRLAT